jgi:hypothetical protein
MPNSTFLFKVLSKDLASRQASGLAALTKSCGFQLVLKSKVEANRGFIMYVVMLLVLSVMGTTIALANRTASGLAGISRQSSLRDAELAAENGLIRTINDMNQPANRYLWGIPSSDWESWYNNKRSSLYPAAACRTDAYGGTYLQYNNDAFDITGQALVFKHIANRVTNKADYQEEWTKGFLFQVLAVTLKNKNHDLITDFSTISKSEPSFVELRVRGTHNAKVNEKTGWETNLDFNYRNGANQSQEHDVSFDITSRVCARSVLLQNRFFI